MKFFRTFHSHAISGNLQKHRGEGSYKYMGLSSTSASAMNRRCRDSPHHTLSHRDNHDDQPLEKFTSLRCAALCHTYRDAYG